MIFRLLVLINAGYAQPVPEPNCSFQTRPEEFLTAQARAMQQVHTRAVKFNRERGVSAGEIPRRNFIDDEIFSKLQNLNVAAAPLSTGEEFLRRVSLDLTGRLPSPEEVRDFLASPNASKRDAMIDRLLASPEFNDKWTWWAADWLQVNSVSTTFSRQPNGRNAFFLWLKAKIGEGSSLKDIAYESVTGSGLNYLMETGAANFPLNAVTPNGPVQDTYDTMLVKTASTFLGVGYYDCLLCHSGRRHLDELSLWGRGATRTDAQRMAAFFSRMQFTLHPDSNTRGTFHAGSRVVLDRAAGQYDLNTTNGNRPARCALNATVANNRCSATGNLTPEYQYNRATPAPGRSWREAFADNMVMDPMFARNLANRLWKELFNLGLVDPVDTLDPARLDPANPPPAPWTLQATHPELLEKLAQELAAGGFAIRPFLKTLVSSSAYQLSSRYGPDWKYEYVPLFARHYARRLEGEEIHDAIVKATGVMPSYPIADFPYSPLQWAMQLPEPREPAANNGNARVFMDAFLRGNRDTQQRSQAGSILQQLSLMNDTFVVTRNKTAASPILRTLAAGADFNATIEELFLRFLSRKPTPAELGEAMKPLRAATTQAARNAAIEDLAWVLINKTEFLFSY